MELVPINRDIVKHLLSDLELFDRFTEGEKDYKSFIVPDGLYLGIFNDDKLIGFWALDSETGTTIGIHCNVLERHREHSMEVGRYFVEYAFRTYPHIMKLNAKIACMYKDVYNFTKKFGFKDEGIDRLSFMKGATLHDRHCLGLTREDYENV